MGGGRGRAVGNARSGAPRSTAISPQAAPARDPFRIALFTLIVITISRIHLQFSLLKAMRPALVIAGIALAIAWARPALLSRRPLLESWSAKLIAAFALLACVGAPFGISLGNSGLFILNDYGKTIIFAFLVIVSIRAPRDWNALVWAMVVSTALLLYTSLFVFQIHEYGGYERLANLDTYDANDLGLVLVVGLAFTLLAFQTAGGWGKVLCAIVMVGIGAAISKSGSRGALLGLSGAGLAMLVLLNRVPVVKRIAFVAATAAGLALFAPKGYWLQMSTMLSPKEDYNWDSLNGRRQVALRGIGYFEEYPLFGLGIHNFAKAECFISDKAKNYVINTGIRCTPPHNAYLEAASELGIGGIVLWLLMIPGSVVMLVRLRRRLPREWATGDPEQQLLYLGTQYLAVAFAGFSVGSFFLSFAWTDVTYFLVASTAGLDIAIRAKLESTSQIRGTDVPILTAAQRRYRAALARPSHSPPLAPAP